MALGGVVSSAAWAVENLSRRLIRDAKFGGSLEESTVIQDGRPSIRRLNMKTEYTDPEKKIRRLSHGPTEKAQKPTKTILLVGPTGSGKSAVLNALINCLLGVSYSDDHRFWITVDEKPGEDQTKSKTSWVTCYELYHQSCFPDGFPFNLRIIDTPGFGDTGGKKSDRAITQQLSDFFNGKGREGVDSLEAIALVVKGTDSRLTEEANYIFGKIMDVFGKDMAPSVLALATHCDDPSGDEHPKVLEALNLANVPYTKHFPLSNTVFLRQQDAKMNQMQRNMNALIFEKNKKIYTDFLFDVALSQPRSLIQTKEQLNERRRLELRVANLQENFLPSAMCQVDKLQKHINIFYRYKEEMKENANFICEETDVEHVKIPINGSWDGATNCKICNVTCHATCTDFGTWFVDWCCAFDHDICTVCPDHCPVSDHALEKFRLEPRKVVRKITLENIKEKYENAAQGKLSQRDIVLKVIKKLEETERQIVWYVGDIEKCLNEIQQITMKAVPTTVEDYIHKLIRDETEAGDAGWEERVEHLKSIKKLTKVSERDRSSFRAFSEPFQKLKREMEAGRGETKD